MEEFNELLGIQISDEFGELEGIEEFRDDDYDYLDWELRFREARRRARPDGKNERIRIMRETFAKAVQLTPNELRTLRQVPRFHRNIQLGKNWSISEDLSILTLNMSKKQLARLLHRTPHSIRKRWSTLRQYGLNRRSVANNDEAEYEGQQ